MLEGNLIFTPTQICKKNTSGVENTFKGEKRHF